MFFKTFMELSLCSSTTRAKHKMPLLLSCNKKANIYVSAVLDKKGKLQHMDGLFTSFNLKQTRVMLSIEGTSRTAVAWHAEDLKQ